MTERKTWRTRHRAVVADSAGGARVVVVPNHEGSGWALPEWETEEESGSTELEEVLREVRTRLGMEVGVLRYVEAREDEAARSRSGTWVLEVRWANGNESAPDGRWVDLTELRGLVRKGEDGWGVAERVLADLAAGASPPGRREWSEPGWLDQAEGWMRGQLAALGRPAVGRIEQVKNNSISSVLRAHTAGGDVYLKAASEHFGQEARITRALAERFPIHLPRVLVADEARSWLLLEDFGPTLRYAELPVWEAALQAMGELQRRCAEERDWLRSIGCAERRLAVLREQIPALVEAPEVRAELEPALWERLVGRVPELQRACDELAACGVPETLIHGDLHGGNVAHGERTPTIFDWTDAAIAHPFLDLVTFLPTERRRPQRIDDAKAAAERLLRAYLEGWSEYASAAQLKRAVELLKTVAQLHHAQSYLQIQRSLEPADYWQWQGELAEWLTPVAAPGTEMRDIFAE